MKNPEISWKKKRIGGGSAPVSSLKVLPFREAADYIEDPLYFPEWTPAEIIQWLNAHGVVHGISQSSGLFSVWDSLVLTPGIKAAIIYFAEELKQLQNAPIPIESDSMLYG